MKKTNHSLLGFAAAATMLGTGAFANPETREGEVASERHDAMSKQVSVEDKNFLDEALRGGTAEVKISELAKNKATNAEVRDLADRMIVDHRKVNEEIKALSKNYGWNVQAKLKEKQRTAFNALQSRTGAEFDEAYIAQLKKDHEATIALFEETIATAASPQVIDFAEKTLPKLRHHLEEVNDVIAETGIAQTVD